MLAQPKRHIVLVGVSGVGKSTVGRALTECLDMPFVDVDDEIVAREGCPETHTVSDIFDISGEEYFRALESETLHEILIHFEPEIVVCGGGAVLNEMNAEMLARHATVVHLTAPLATIRKRIVADSTARPLMDDADDATFEARYRARKIAADAIADVTIDTTTKTIEEVVKEICEELDGILHT